MKYAATALRPLYENNKRKMSKKYRTTEAANYCPVGNGNKVAESQQGRTRRQEFKIKFKKWKIDWKWKYRCTKSVIDVVADPFDYSI